MKTKTYAFLLCLLVTFSNLSLAANVQGVDADARECARQMITAVMYNHQLYKLKLDSFSINVDPNTLSADIITFEMSDKNGTLVEGKIQADFSRRWYRKGFSISRLYFCKLNLNFSNSGIFGNIGISPQLFFV